MTNSEWDRLAGFVAALWPGSPWEPNTAEAGWLVCSDLEFDITRQVVTAIARSGERFSPPPGVLYAKVQEQIEASTPALPPPDAVRDLTPDEIKRTERWRPRLKQVMAELAARRELRYEDSEVLDGEVEVAPTEEPPGHVAHEATG